MENGDGNYFDEKVASAACFTVLASGTLFDAFCVDEISTKFDFDDEKNVVEIRHVEIWLKGTLFDES